MLIKFRDFILNLLFPAFCFGCGREGSYLCQDCFSILEISQYQYCLCKVPQRVINKGKCQRCSSKKLSGLYSVIDYQNHLVKNLIQKFKYEPFIKTLAMPLASLIITHFQLLEKPTYYFSNFILIPVPLEKKRRRWRGYNQAEEITKELVRFLEIPAINDVLIKIKETPPQTELSGKEREENIKGVFLIKNKEKIKGRKILLVDDVYTTGATMEECARVLKEAGAKVVWGIVIARG